MNEPIYFCEPLYYPLSNFSAFQLVWKGRVWPTSEHAYQAEKFTDEAIIEALSTARSVDEAYEVAQIHKEKRRTDWDEIKVEVMRSIFVAKINQHPKIKKMLLESGERMLIKDSSLDAYWGWGPQKDGLNMMGKLWMEIRDEVRAQETVSS